MAGRVEHIERNPLDGQLVALGDAHRDHIHLALLAHHGDALRPVAQRAQPGDMVGMQMRIDGLDQFQIELAHQLQVAVNLLQHGIDDQCLPAGAAGEQIGIGARNLIEQLTEDHANNSIARCFK